MMPVAPDLTVRSLTEQDIPTLANLLNQALLMAPYSAPFDLSVLQDQVFATTPPTLFPMRWQQRQPLGAWRAGELVGFLDIAIGFDRDHLHLPSFQPIGLLRFLALPARADLLNDVGAILLERAEAFWLAAGVRYVKAYDLSIGYPHFQAGAGMLPSTWTEHVQLFTARGYHLTQRFQCLCRMLEQPVEEYFPQAELSLVQTQMPNGHAYRLYRRIDTVGEAHVVHFTPDSRTVLYPPDIDELPIYPASVVRSVDQTNGDVSRIAYLAEIGIGEDWRGRDIGKLLLRRILNDATLLGFEQMIVFLSPQQDIAWSLFAQQGFQELNYRGYVLDKVLT